jgi:hypothetical protein
MNNLDISISLESVKKFLLFRGWTLSRTRKEFEFFTPPKSLALPEGFEFALPAHQKSNGDALVIDRTIRSITDIYGFTPSDITVLLTGNRNLIQTGDSGFSSVWSTRLIGAGTEDGSISLKAFDMFLGESKKLLLDSAAFALTNAPRIESRPPAAESFFESCRFLQTQRGSFIASFEIPEIVIRQRGFEQPEITASAIASKLISLIQLVTDRVFAGHQDIFTEDFLFERADVISYEVLRDFENLLRKSESDEIEFSLKTLEDTTWVSTGFLTDLKLRDLERFVDFVRENTSAEFPVNASGHIVELRSSDPGKDRNYVLVRRSNDHTLDLALYLTSEQYHIALNAHGANRPIHIAGMATQLKTKSRMTRIDHFGLEARP